MISLRVVLDMLAQVNGQFGVVMNSYLGYRLHVIFAIILDVLSLILVGEPEEYFGYCIRSI